MAKAPRARLRDILDAIVRIRTFQAGRTPAAYRGDEQFRDALERNLERISEASRHIPSRLKAEHPEIPWQDIADIGNVLRHAYDRVSPDLIWDVLEHDLPVLETVAGQMLRGLKD